MDLEFQEKEWTPKAYVKQNTRDVLDQRAYNAMAIAPVPAEVCFA